MENDLNKRLNALCAVVQIAGGKTAPKQILYDILHVLSKCLELTHGLIMLNEWNGRPLTVHITDIESESSQILSSLSSQSAAAAEQVIRTSSPAVDSNLCRTLNLTDQAASWALLCVPIQQQDHAVGALAVILSAADDSTQQEILRLLNTAAGIISLLHRTHLPLPDTARENTASDNPLNRLDSGKLRSQIISMEEEMILEALKQAGGRIRLACLQLGITQRMLRYKLKKLGIDHKQFFTPKTKRPAAERRATSQNNKD